MNCLDVREQLATSTPTIPTATSTQSTTVTTTRDEATRPPAGKDLIISLYS
jgi:hypothetical protein